MTQDFLALGATSTSVRYYTQFDPYFYTIDNRPLEDIASNIADTRSGGVDSARRSLLLSALASTFPAKQAYMKAGVTTFMTGLEVSSTATNSLTVNQGSIYEMAALTPTLTELVLKQAISVVPQTFSFTPPTTAGTSQVFTIEGQFVSITSTSMTTSRLPYVDSTNAYMPSTLLHGELVLQVNTNSVAATTGTQVAPATTAGWFPIYNVTFTQGTVNPVIQAHPNAPSMPGLSIVPPVSLNSTNGATTSVANDMVMYSFADAVTSGIVLPLSIDSDSINPFKPVLLKLTTSPTVTAGNWSLRVRYKALTTGDLVSSATTTTSTETVAVTAPASSIQTNTTSVAVIPNTAFSGFSNGSWTVVKNMMTVVLERLGADAGDTNTGVMNLLEVELFQ